MKKIIPILLIINNMLFIVSLSLSFVMLFRPFYYWHINSLDLPKETGYTYSEIKEAYDDVMDYMVLNKPFKTGNLKYSDNGKNHFQDCKTLFIINFVLCGITGIIIILKKKFFNNIKFMKHNISFWSSSLIMLLFSIFLLISLTFGFNVLFNFFHKILFIGKSNWHFNDEIDEIINILPEKYFLNCAILLLIIVSIISGLIIVIERKKQEER